MEDEERRRDDDMKSGRRKHSTGYFSYSGGMRFANTTSPTLSFDTSTGGCGGVEEVAWEEAEGDMFDSWVMGSPDKRASFTLTPTSTTAEVRVREGVQWRDKGTGVLGVYSDKAEGGEVRVIRGGEKG